MTKPREITREIVGAGGSYRLTIVQDKAEAPPFADNMLRALFDEMGAQGYYRFHPKGPLDAALQIADPRVIARLHSDGIEMSMRWGPGPENSVTGSLSPPPGKKAPELVKEMSRRLEYLNGDHWADLGLNGSAKPPMPAPSASVQPITIAPASAQAPSRPALLDKDEVLAFEFLEKATANRTITGTRIREHLHKHHPEPGNRGFVGEAIARLEGKGVLRRVRIENAGEWQFTEAYLSTRGRTLGGYRPLPEVVAGKPGVHRPPVEARPALAAVPKATSVAPVSSGSEHPSLKKLKELYANLDGLSAERSRAVEEVEAAQRAVRELDSKVASAKEAIAAAEEPLTKQELLAILLHRQVP